MSIRQPLPPSLYADTARAATPISRAHRLQPRPQLYGPDLRPAARHRRRADELLLAGPEVRLRAAKGLGVPTGPVQDGRVGEA